MTPAQASGHPNFVTDVPIQGPTDEGVRAASCWHAQHRLPKDPACVDCGGPIPQWTRNKLCPGNRLTNSGIGDNMETISFGGSGALGFALGHRAGAGTAGLGAAGDPEVWTKLTAAQQTWVVNTLVKLDQKIRETTKTSCPTFGPSITAAGGCFQQWFNTAFAGAPVKKLRTDGVFDLDTLNALLTTTGIYVKDFPAAFPGTLPAPPSPPPEEKKKLSTGAMVGIGLAGATALGGIVWAATRKPARRRRR